MGRRVQYKGTDAALKGAATFKKGAAVLRPYKEEPRGRPLRPIGVSGWWTGGGSLPEARASRARRRALSSAEVMRRSR
jgi:hypothetical protein